MRCWFTHVYIMTLCIFHSNAPILPHLRTNHCKTQTLESKVQKNKDLIFPGDCFILYSKHRMSHPVVTTTGWARDGGIKKLNEKVMPWVTKGCICLTNVSHFKVKYCQYLKVALLFKILNGKTNKYKLQDFSLSLTKFCGSSNIEICSCWLNGCASFTGHKRSRVCHRSK